jgi:hypothetical protein
MMCDPSTNNITFVLNDTANVTFQQSNTSNCSYIYASNFGDGVSSQIVGIPQDMNDTLSPVQLNLYYDDNTMSINLCIGIAFAVMGFIFFVVRLFMTCCLPKSMHKFIWCPCYVSKEKCAEAQRG